MAINPDLITTVRVGELPPASLELTSKFAHEIGDDLKRATIQELIDIIRANFSAAQYEEKTIHAPNTTYITDNFDMTVGVTQGIGKIGSIWEGWAICNGNNGTPNKDGIVGIGYGALYPTVGQFGGSEETILTINQMPAHSHEIDMVGYNLVTGAGAEFVVRSTGTQVAKPTNSKGGADPINKMQPFIVELKIMKL